MRGILVFFLYFCPFQFQGQLDGVILELRATITVSNQCIGHTVAVAQ